MKESIKSLALQRLDSQHSAGGPLLCEGLVGLSCREGRLPSLLCMSECLVRDSTLALPERNLVKVTALETSLGDVPQVVKRGWVVERNMKLGWKYFKLSNAREARRNVFIQGEQCHEGENQHLCDGGTTGNPPTT